MSEEKQKENGFTDEQLERYKNDSVSSFILSMIGIAFLPTVIGLLVLGIISLSRANRVPGSFKKAPYRSLCNIGRGFAIFEIIFVAASAVIGIIVFLIYLIVLAAAAAAAAGAGAY